MKILYVFFHSYTDMPYHTREWVEAALELGHEVTVITAIDPAFLEQIGWKDKIQVIQVEYPGQGFLNYFKLFLNFKRTIKETLQSGDFNVIYERFSNISPATAYLAKKCRQHYAIEVNGIVDEELALSGTSFARRLFFRLIQRYVYKKATVVISVTEHIREWLARKYKITLNSIKTIPNGVNPKRFHPCEIGESREKFNFPEEKYIIGYLGTLCPWYDLEIFIRTAVEIIKKIPEAYFVIGGGQEPIKTELEEQVVKNGLEKYFVFSGQVPWGQAAAFTSSFDVAVAPINFSNDKYEVSPLKLASYMACEKPVIGSNTSGMAELIEKTKCGLVYKDDKSFVSSIIKIYSFNGKKALEMGIRGKNYVCANNTWELQVKKTLSFIISK